MATIICDTSSQLLQNLSAIPDGEHALVSIADDGKVYVERCDDQKWRVATELPGSETAMIQKVLNALADLAAQEKAKLSLEHNPITGRHQEAVVEFDGYRIPADVFAEQVRRMDITDGANIGRAIRNNSIWETVRLAENPQKTDTDATQCQFSGISDIQPPARKSAIDDVGQLRKKDSCLPDVETATHQRREELRMKLEAWQSENTTDNGIDSKNLYYKNKAVKRVLEAFDTNAKRLELSDLILKSLPPLDGLLSLEVLDLNVNQFERLHVLLENFPVLPSLIEITLDSYSGVLLALPAKFESHAPKLHTVNKLYKWLNEQQYDDQASLKKLRTAVDRIKQAIINNTEDLDLSDLGLKTLPPLTGLSSVRTINLSGNSLIQVESLPVLPSVKEVDLSNNVLMYLPTDLAARFPQAVRLNLSDNLLTVIPAATKMPKGGPSEPFELQLSNNFLTRATVRAHCDPEFAPEDFSRDNLIYRDAFDKHNTVYVDRKAAYMAMVNLLDFSSLPGENPKLDYALEQLSSAQKVIEQRASYTDRYNTNYEEILSASVPPATLWDGRKFSDAVAYFFCLANEEIPPKLLDQLMEPFNDRPLVTVPTEQSLLLDLRKYTQIRGFSQTTNGYDMDVNTRKEVARRIVTLLKEAAKNEDTRRNLIETAGEASSTCSDRAELSLFEREQVMLANKRITEYSSAVSAPEKQYQQQCLLDMFKQIALIREAGSLALKEASKRNLGVYLDEVEVVLSFYVALRELGHLSFGPDKMEYNFNHLGAFSLEKVQAYIPELLTKVESKDSYEIAAQIPEWEAYMMKHDPECKKRCDEALAERSEALGALYDNDPGMVEAFKRSLSDKYGLGDMSEDDILQKLDDEYQTAKSKVIAERSRHFLSENEPLPRAVGPQFGPLHSRLDDHTAAPSYSIQS